MRNIVFLAVFSVVLQAIFAHENDLQSGTKHSEEKLSVAVKIIEEEYGKNGPRFTEVIVKLNVTIAEDVVKVNGKLTELDVVTKYELDAEIVYSEKDIRFSPVEVHVMVMRKQLKNGHQFLIEEQVQLIEGKRVEQVDVQVLTIHLDVNGKEFKRTVEMISFEESRIKNSEVERFCGKGDSKPRKWREPEIPDEKGWGNNRHKHHGKGLCSRFHKLPFGARVAILVGLVFVVLASIMCCATCCCRKSKKAYKISKGDDFKSEFEIDDEEEAEPLPEKLAFDDKDVLIA